MHEPTPELAPCPFCRDPMEMNNGGYAKHVDQDQRCPLSKMGWTDIDLWNTRADTAHIEALEANLAKAETSATAAIVWALRDLRDKWHVQDLTSADFDPADSAAALDKLLAEARREGMERALNIVSGCDRVSEVRPAILAEMEKL